MRKNTWTRLCQQNSCISRHQIQIQACKLQSWDVFLPTSSDRRQSSAKVVEGQRSGGSFSVFSWRGSKDAAAALLSCTRSNQGDVASWTMLRNQPGAATEEERTSVRRCCAMMTVLAVSRFGWQGAEPLRSGICLTIKVTV